MVEALSARPTPLVRWECAKQAIGETAGKLEKLNVEGRHTSGQVQARGTTRKDAGHGKNLGP